MKNVIFRVTSGISFGPLLILLSMLSGCNFIAPQAASTPDSPATVAARTLEVVFTQSSSGTEIPLEGTSKPDNSTDMINSTPTLSKSDCLNKAIFVDDITIRDNAKVESGESFVKIWRIRNDGTCIWDHTYNLAFISGERMAAPAKNALPQIVQPGQTIDLSIDMTAPEPTGTYQGFWRLQSDQGEFFGIGSSGEQSFWVRINVVSSIAATPTIIYTPSVIPTTEATQEQTPSPTESPTPSESIYFQGSSSLGLGQSINLDDGELDPQAGSDLALMGTSEEEAALTPQNSTLIAAYTGDSPFPTQNDCQNTQLDNAPITLTGLAVDDIICYSTGDGRFGHLKITALDATVEFSFVTWGS